MGRPLYSRTFITTPAVREPEQPICEKWSYLNPFDPDSDEFFDNENAVYEDFIDSVTPANPEEEDEEEERDMLVLRMGNASPITSESSLSDNESLLAAGAEGPADLVVDAFQAIRRMDEPESEQVARVRLAFPPMRQPTATRVALRSPYRPYYHRDTSLPVPAPSAPIPVPAVSRRSTTVDGAMISSPSTPPRQTPVTHVSMSPPPTSTPRLYTWARNPSHSTSPSSGSPFSNPHARTSYTHLSPAFNRIRDVTV
jgi:hypothetical protein